MFHIIYVSTAVEPMSNDALKELLNVSRVNNERNRITGMLLYKNGHFMQVIEGEEAHVTELMNIIKKDIRHKNVDILRSEYKLSRDFPNWTMGFQNLERSDYSKIPGFTKLLESDFKPEYFAEHTTEAHALLLAFKENTKSNDSLNISQRAENNTDQSPENNTDQSPE